jgi:MFS family permease
MAAFSLRLSDRAVMRFGVRPPLVAGLLLAGASLALFGRAPVHGSFVLDVLPSMLLLGAGAGLAFNPVLLAAMGDVEPHESGLASGVVNTSFMMGGALGLAVFVSLSSGRMTSELAAGAGQVAALNSGLHVAFVAGGIAAVAAAVLGAVLLRPKPMAAPAESGAAGVAGLEEPDPEPCAA